MKLPLLFVILLIGVASANAQVNITIDSTTKFQTIEGWGHGGDLFSMCNYGLDSSIRDSVNHGILDYLVADLGLTGSRMWEVGPRIDGTATDDGDCDSVNWSKFEVDPIDTMVGNYTVFFKNHIEANGYKTSFYSSPGYPTHASDQKPWVMYDPGERAQQLWANALWWKQNYGITINYDVIYNEPSSPVTSVVLADDAIALGPRAVAHGLPLKTQFAECVAPLTDWSYITPERSNAALWPYVGRISYHDYGTADPYRMDLWHFADSLGITTAQTEMQNPTIDDIFNDMLLGGTSYWEVAYSGGNTLVSDTGNTSFNPSGTYFRLRQVIHYVRPGAVRVQATSSDSNVRVLSFVRNGTMTTVVLNNTADTIANLSGLVPGSYAVSQCPSGATAFKELGVFTVGADGKLQVRIVAAGYATTIYPYSGANHPPTIETITANPGYLVSPTSIVTLKTQASDPELDPLTYTWSVASEPAGANATFTNIHGTTTNATGLTVAGDYVFSISVTDNINVSSRKIYVIVYPSNPPPGMGQLGFRIAAPYGLVFSNLPDTTHAQIELPVSSAILQAGIGDLANDDFTGRGKWTLVSEPAGANAFVDTTTYIFISIRAQVTGMTVPGDYVFQINVTYPGHPDLVQRIICTVHPASSGPVINSLTANPPKLTLPISTTQLTSATIDTSGQQMRYWWEIKEAPAGVNLSFDHQGLGTSNVSGLTAPGYYTFTLRAFDDIHETTKDITVVVSKASSVAELPIDPNGIRMFPNPASKDLNVQLTDASDRTLRVEVLNMLGEKAYDAKMQSDQNGFFSLPVNMLPSGMYFLTAQTSDKIFTGKFLRQ